MKLRLYERADAPEVLRLWNTAGAAAGYAPLDAGKLDVLLLAHPAFCTESTFVLEERGAVCVLPRAARATVSRRAHCAAM